MKRRVTRRGKGKWEAGRKKGEEDEEENEKEGM
jgi:hypothetical protein